MSKVAFDSKAKAAYMSAPVNACGHHGGPRPVSESFLWMKSCEHASAQAKAAFSAFPASTVVCLAVSAVMVMVRREVPQSVAVSAIMMVQSAVPQGQQQQQHDQQSFAVAAAALQHALVLENF